jgi:TonB-linked SusC/RagA family outer membrane protein
MKQKLLNCLIAFVMLLSTLSSYSQTTKITGTVTSDNGEQLPGASVVIVGTTKGTTTNSKGAFVIEVLATDKLKFSLIGFLSKEIVVGNQTNIDLILDFDDRSLDEVVVIGFGTQKKESVTGSIAVITSKDIERVHAGSTVSSGLAGKIAGVTFRQADARPGSAASIQIRNMGIPLFIIDGIQQDQGQFNNIAPNDIESISVLKDAASAAVYGARAANGVVVVTTKKGTGETKINFDANYGFQNYFRYPKALTSSYDYLYYRADAELNGVYNGGTGKGTAITQELLNGYKAAQNGDLSGPNAAYKSFDWQKYIFEDNANAPMATYNVNFSGGSEKVNYYVSATNLNQKSNLGKEWNFNRTNFQSNVTAKPNKNLSINMNINGRLETRTNPGVPGGDDYNLPSQAILRNTPLERPFANDNPKYLSDLGGHAATNYAFLNETLGGKFKQNWRVLTTGLTAEYSVPAIKGLKFKGNFSHYVADLLYDNHEYTFITYGYNATNNTYFDNGKGSTNPWREREQRKEFNTTTQGLVTYDNKFGKHTIGSTFVAERIFLKSLRNWIHSVPISNNLPLIYFPTVDRYDDSENSQASIGYVGRVSYDYADKYYVEASARRDSYYIFDPVKRVGYFPSVSAGWRLTEEPFMKKLLKNENILSDFKLRGSYGLLGDNRNIVAPYAYLPGYNYNVTTNVLDGQALLTSRDKGLPTNLLSWTQSLITDIGIDFGMFNNKLTGTIEYFYRKRTGLPGTRNDILLPSELGYSLPQENLRSDAQYGEELSLSYQNNFRNVKFNFGGNIGYTRSKNLISFNPIFSNSLDQYRNSTENRLSRIDWGYEVQGQFSSQEQINNYKVNIDGQGNKTLIPGDLIYKDQNGDGKIDSFDERPIGYGGFGNTTVNPNINFGFTVGASYKSFTFQADFSGGSGLTWFQNNEMRWAFQNGSASGGNLNTIFLDRWHRSDVYDLNSAWIPGKFPANRFDPKNGHSNYAANSDFWMTDVKFFRARTMEFAYTIPSKYLNVFKLKNARVYLNGYNLFSFDNLKSLNVDPEISNTNGIQAPQNRIVNFGFNLSF